MKINPVVGQISNPTLMFKTMRWLVRSGIMLRGYGWLLRHLPSWFWVNGYILGTVTKSIIVDTDVGRMVLPIWDSSAIGLMIFGTLRHEVGEQLLLTRLLPECQIVFDVGANVGFYSRFFAKWMKKPHVFAFEPDPRIFLYLHENLRAQGLVCFKNAVGASDGYVDFFVATRSDLSATARRVSANVISVPSITLDEFCISRQLIGQIDLIKCDVEGGEIAVLQGARKIRSSHNPPIWMLEVEEGFLSEAHVSAEELTEELLHCGAIHLFYADVDGKPISIHRIGERKGTNNIFVVPKSRLYAFCRLFGI